MKVSVARAESLHLNLTTEEGPIIRGRSGLEEFSEENIASMKEYELGIIILLSVMTLSFQPIY